MMNKKIRITWKRWTFIFLRIVRDSGLENNFEIVNERRTRKRGTKCFVMKILCKPYDCTCRITVPFGRKFFFHWNWNSRIKKILQSTDSISFIGTFISKKTYWLGSSLRMIKTLLKESMNKAISRNISHSRFYMNYINNLSVQPISLPASLSLFSEKFLTHNYLQLFRKDGRDTRNVNCMQRYSKLTTRFFKN